MDLKYIKNYLPKVFEVKDKDTNTERVCFNDDIMKSDNVNYPIYIAISNAMRESELSFNFSYEIASRAVDILAEVDGDWSEDGDYMQEESIAESIDSSVPIYTSEVMKIYQSDSWAVDEAVKNFGSSEDSNSEQNAKMGWYNQIEQMVQAIATNLQELVLEDEAIDKKAEAEAEADKQ